MTTQTNSTNAFAEYTNHTSKLQNNYQSSQGSSDGVANPASIKQIETYTKLCTRKSVQPLDVTKMSKGDISKEIGKVIALPFPPSESQYAKITELMELLNNNGVTVRISDEKMATLTGGKEGTASQLIEFLFNKKNSANIAGAIREAQVEQILTWFLCPDIAFESVEITVVHPIKPGANVAETQTETLSINRQHVTPRPDVAENAVERTFFTPDEFRAELRSKLNEQQASAFIDKHKDVFYEWKKTRATDRQISFIQTLEQRLASLYVPKESPLAMDDQGNIIDVVASTNSVYNPVAHEAMTLLQLAQLSFDDAKMLIEQFQASLADRSYESAYNDDQEDLHDKHATYNDERGTGRVTKSVAEARLHEFYLINDFLYSLDSIAGFENTDLHEGLREVVLDNSKESETYQRKLIRAMFETVDFATQASTLRSIARLETMSGESVILNSVFDTLKEDIKGVVTFEIN